MPELQGINYAFRFMILCVCLFVIYWTFCFKQFSQIGVKSLFVGSQAGVIARNHDVIDHGRFGKRMNDLNDVPVSSPSYQEVSIPSIINSTFLHKQKFPSRISSSKTQGCKVSKYHFIRCPRPTGRLGNMMFQLAATLGIAHALKYRPIISHSNPMVKLFSLNNVKQVAWGRSKREIMVPHKQWMSGTWLKNHSDYVCHNLSISGYYQTWKVFNDVPANVRNAFSIKAEHLEKARAFLAENTPRSKTIIGIHVRRGDFLSPKSQRRGRIVASKTYISKAMRFFRHQYKNAFFIVCSNDMKWCRENIADSDVIYSNFTYAILDMAVMSLCDHMIITRGSFGWWGGWLSGGTVVYLKKLHDENFSAGHHLPHWIGMSNN